MRRVSLAAIGLTLLCAAYSVAADDPSGTWTYTAMLGKKSADLTLKLKLEGDKLTGAISGQGNREIPIAEGSFKDGKVSFKVSREQKGETFTQKYNGALSGDTIKGTVESERGGKSRSQEWEAKRQK